MYWQCHDVFGPARRMHRPTIRWRSRGWRKVYRKGRGELKYNRPKWTWHPRHVLNRRAPMRTEMSNKHFLAQLDRCVMLIRPPHKRRPIR